METTLQDFFAEFRQSIMAGGEANSTSSLREFVTIFGNELAATGSVEDFDLKGHEAASLFEKYDQWAKNKSAEYALADLDSGKITFAELEKTRADYSTGSYLVIAPLVFLVLANRAIRKDELRVRSADRLR